MILLLDHGDNCYNMILLFILLIRFVILLFLLVLSVVAYKHEISFVCYIIYNTITVTAYNTGTVRDPIIFIMSIGSSIRRIFLILFDPYNKGDYMIIYYIVRLLFF